MSRQARSLLKGKQLFHVMVQGIKKERIFLEHREKCEYIKLLKKYSKEYEIEMMSYCIMDNHVHILIKTKDIENLTKYMHKVDTSYAIYYNKNKKRVGYVYRDRFKTQLIQNEEHLYNCIVYIHNNPVKAKICEFPWQYKYSSYKNFMSENNKEILEKIFINKYLYKKAHTKLYADDMNFLEDDEEILIDIENEINNYLLINNTNMIELKVNDKLLKPIVIKLNKAYNLSNRKISKYLDIGRERIRKINNNN